MVKLNLGSGKQFKEGYINVDINPDIEPDIVHDLNKFPYPFGDQTVDVVILSHLLEHLDSVTAVLEELHRIVKKDGKIVVVCPYFRSIWAHLDPTHKHFFTVDTLSYYDVNHIYYQKYAYSKIGFVIERKVFNEKIDKSWFRRLVLIWANRYPNAYETYFSHLYPMEDITYYLRRV